MDDKRILIVDDEATVVDLLREVLTGQGYAVDTAHDGLADDFPTLQQLEQRYIARVLEHCDGNRTQAATMLGVDKSTLWRKLKLQNGAG